MFRKSKKKAPAPVVVPRQSRADSYIIGAPPDFAAEQDFYKASFLKSSSASDRRSNPESTSLSSAASSSTTTSEDARNQSSKNKTGSTLTFSTFLGTPKMSRKKGKEDAGKFSKPPKPDKKPKSGAASTEEEDSSSSSSGKSKDKKAKKQDGTGQKKQSVMSKMKQALSTPRLGRKTIKDVPGTPPRGRSSTKPPPPTPKRTSSLTRDEERRKFGQIDVTDTSELRFVNISDFDEEPKLSIETPATSDSFLPNTQIPVLVNGHMQGLTNALGTLKDFKTMPDTESPNHCSDVPVDEEPKTISLEIGSIDVAMSDRLEEVDSEIYDDTLQSVDYISDDEASESISSSSVSNSASNSISNSMSNSVSKSTSSSTRHSVINSARNSASNSMSNTASILASSSHSGLLKTFSLPIELQKQSPDQLPSANVTYEITPERTTGSLSHTQSSTCDNTLPEDGISEYCPPDDTSLKNHGDSGKSESFCDMSQSKDELVENNKSSMSFETTVWDSPCRDKTISSPQKSMSSFYTGTFITDLKGLRNSPEVALNSTFITDGEQLESEDLSEENCHGPEYSSSNGGGSPKLNTVGQPNKQEHSSNSPKFRMTDKMEKDSALSPNSAYSSDSDSRLLSDRQSAGGETQGAASGNGSVPGVSRITPLNQTYTQEGDDNVFDLTLTPEPPLSPVAPPRRKRTASTPSPTSRKTDGQRNSSQIMCGSDIQSSSTPPRTSANLNVQHNQVRNTNPGDEVGNADKGKEKRLSSPKPPVGPKPHWIKEKINSPGLEMEEATSKAGKPVDKSAVEEDSAGKAPQTTTTPRRSSNSRTLTRQSAQHQHSDTDSVSSSGYESKSPGKGQSPKVRPATSQATKWKKATTDEESTATDDDIAMLSNTESSSSELLMINRSATSARTATPTLELYHNAWDIGPESRCLPSPCPDNQSCILVESDDSAERVEKNKMNLIEVPKVMIRKGSPHITQFSKSMHLGVYSNMDYNNELSPYPRTPHNTPLAQLSLHHSRSVDADMEIAESFLTPRLQTNTQSLGSSMYRSSTPTIDHIRHLQNDRSCSTDIVVDNLKYRPSTPLIGGHSLDLADVRSRPMITKDLLRARISTPVLGMNAIRDFNEEVLSPRRQPLIAMRPQSSLDSYNNGVPENNALSREPDTGSYNLTYDVWRNLAPGAGSAQQRRPPSPVLRAKVNSVLDSLINKPIARGARSPHTRSVSAGNLLSGQNLLKLPQPSRLNESYNPNTDLNAPLQSSYLTPTLHRPPSPFNRFSPRPDYNDQSDIDMEFEFQGPVLEGWSELGSARRVPPLDLGFIRRRSEESVLTPGITDRIDRTPGRSHNGTLLSGVQVDNSFHLDSYLQSLPSNSSDVRHSFPGYRESGNRQDISQGLMPVQRETSVDGGEDHTPEISSACLELSTPVTSDSESEMDGVTTRRDVQWGWQVKAAESWSTMDVAEWCSAYGFQQTAAAFKERGLTGQDLMMMGEEHMMELGVQDEAEREFFMSELHKLRLKPKSAASLWRLKQTSMKRRTLETSSELLKERLYSLQQLSSDQDQRIDSSMEEIIKQQQQTDQLLGRTNSDYSREQLTTHNHHNGAGIAGVPMDVPLIKWSPEDVEAWLKASGLEKFTPTFQAHHVRGRDLAGISLQFLDDLAIHSTNDRELLLSKLYDLQRPSLEEDMNSPQVTHQEPMVSMETKPFSSPSKNSSLQHKLKDMVSPRKFGGRQEEKTIRISHDVLGYAGCTDVKIPEATTSVEAVQKVLEELELSDDINLFYLSVTAPHLDREETELGKFECPLSVARQAPGGGTKFELRKRLGITIKAICHMSGMKPRGKGFRVSPFSSSPELLQVALRKFHMSHVDPSLFCLLPVNKETGDVRLMADSEIVQDCETHTFMLTHQENVDHLLNTTDDTVPLLEQHKQILRRNSSLNSHGSSALSQSSEASQGSDSGKPRFEHLESLEARMADIEASLASNLLEVDQEDAGSPDRLPLSARHVRIPPSGRRKNYNQPEPKVQPPPIIQTSRYITPKKQKLPSSDTFRTQDIQPDDHLELMREIALMRQSVQERDAAISDLRHQNDILETQSKQVEELKTQLTEVTLRQQEQEQNMREQLLTAHQTLEVKHRQLEHANQALQGEHRRRGPPEDDDSDSGRETNRSTRDSTPGSTSDLSNDLEQLERELLSAQNEARILEDELTDLRSRRQRALQDSRVSGDTINVQLLSEDCSIAEAKLLRVKQRHADIYARLELTKKEHEKAQKTKAGPCLYDTLSPGPPQGIVCVELSSSDGPGFIPGRDRQDRIIVKHLAEGLPLCKGDRLLEVNGQRVFHLEDTTLHQILREVRIPVKLVVIRDIKDRPTTGADTSEEMDAMKEDLSLAMLEVESSQQENQDLTNEVEKLKTNNQRLKDNNEELRQELHIIRRKMEESNHQNHETHTTNNNTELSNSPKLAANEQTTFTRRDNTAKKKLRFGDDFETGTSEPELPHLTNGTRSQPEEVIAYDRLDASVPIWEGLRKASKREVLQVLKDHVMETSQQKCYLDRLMAVVIDNAPDLLDHVDAAIGVEDTMCWKPQSEEFC